MGLDKNIYPKHHSTKTGCSKHQLAPLCPPIVATMQWNHIGLTLRQSIHHIANKMLKIIVRDTKSRILAKLLFYSSFIRSHNQFFLNIRREA